MSVISNIKQMRHDAYIWKFTHQKIQNNKIILWADSFKHFGCSPKYIALYLLKNYPGKFDIVWVFETGSKVPEDLPEGIRTVEYFSIDYLRELHTAKFVICNMRTGDAYYWHKRPEQVYIQTWHSSLRLKKIEGDAIESLGEEFAQKAKKDSEKIDLLLSGCDFSTDIFKRAFWYDGEILKSGTPRCDVLISGNADAKEKVYSTYNIPQGNKLMLYAPTFRKNKKADVYGMDFSKLDKAVNDNNSDNKWSFGCRLHPNIHEEFSDEKSVSMSKYSDMQELLAASDLLITDYSSCMFDMAIAKKPCVLYLPDLEEYMSNERGLYFDITELPFPIARDMDEVCSIIKNFDMQKYLEKLAVFTEKIGNYEDGHAAQRVAEYIINRM